MFTLEFALGAISPNGVIVIEDIEPSALPIWQIVQYEFLLTKYQAHIVKTKAAYVFIVTQSEVLSALLSKS